MQLRTVLCPLDFTPLSDRALELATGTARRFGARLVIEHNLDPRPPGYLSVTWMWSEDHESEKGAQARDAERRLQEYLEGLPGDLPREACLTRGPVVEGLQHLARQFPADLIVMASHGRSSSEHHSLTEDLIVRAPCPVLALAEEHTPERAGEDRPILVPVDLSPHSRATVRLALDLSGALSREVHVLHVNRRPEPTEARGESLRRLEALVPAEVRRHVQFHASTGTAAEEILRLGEELGIGLLVMGCHPKGMLERMFTGATACDVLHRSPWPIWYVPAGMPVAEPVEV